MATLAFDIGIVNMALCVSEHRIVRYCNVFAIGRPKDPLDILIRQLLIALQEQEQAIGCVAHVRIEQQLGRAATKNFALSAVLFAYFTKHCPHADVQFVSPRKKFKELAQMQDVPGISERSEEFKATRGPKLKKLAVEASRALAAHVGDDQYLKRLAAQKKKDDMADSHVMSLLC
jgi:hypothetical protein